MFSSLDASGFRGSVLFYERQFEEILQKITACYRLMVADEVVLENNENKIRDVLLLDYLKSNQVRNDIGLLPWHFEREVPEDQTIGRTDIKVISQNTFIKQEAYYILECKRLDNVNTNGRTGLNAKYIENGVCRFTSQYYTSYHRVNGLIGFIIEKLDIHSNVNKINTLLSSSFENISTTKQITRDDFIEGFEHHYHSIHSNNNGSELKLYHLMFDFSKNMDRRSTTSVKGSS